MTARERATRRLSGGPLIKNCSEEDHRPIMGRWFHQGERVRKATTGLNKIMRSDGNRTRFDRFKQDRE